MWLSQAGGSRGNGSRGSGGRSGAGGGSTSTLNSSSNPQTGPESVGVGIGGHRTADMIREEEEAAGEVGEDHAEANATDGDVDLCCGYRAVTEVEVEAIAALRHRLADLLPVATHPSLDVRSDGTLIRFIRASPAPPIKSPTKSPAKSPAKGGEVKADDAAERVEQAEKMFRATFAWRAEYGADALPPLPRILLHYRTGGFCGRDREGNPIYYERPGMMDLAGILKHVTIEDIILNRVYRSEEATRVLRECSTATRQYGQITVVMDLAGLAFQHMTPKAVSILRANQKISSSNYPERLKRMVIINAPFTFRYTWRLIQSFINSRTRHKVRVRGCRCGGREGGWEKMSSCCVCSHDGVEAY